MADKKPRNDDAKKDNKTELANRIAEQSQKVARTYANVEDVLIRATRLVSSVIDRILFNRKCSLLVSHQINRLQLELTLPVHETAIVDSVFPAPLLLGKLRITVEAFKNGLAPLFDTDHCNFLVHVSSPSQMVSVLSEPL